MFELLAAGYSYGKIADMLDADQKPWCERVLPRGRSSEEGGLMTNQKRVDGRRSALVTRRESARKLRRRTPKPVAGAIVARSKERSQGSADPHP